MFSSEDLTIEEKLDVIIEALQEAAEERAEIIEKLNNLNPLAVDEDFTLRN